MKDSRYYREIQAQNLKLDFEEKRVRNMEQRIYISLPDDKNHANHPVGEVCQIPFLTIVDKKVCKCIAPSQKNITRSRDVFY